ncbi:MAG: DUF4091 domain-containing protein, partial [Thermoguttaceae bacterium]|nr:DUF4091 domain-containing protein [Thermoguttaceae bacterium]
VDLYMLAILLADLRGTLDAPTRRKLVADLRLKALRDGQQLIEYLTLLSERRRVSREEIRAAIEAALGEDSPSDLSRLTAWQLAELRRRVAAWLAK